MNKQWHSEAIELHRQGLSGRTIGKILSRSKSAVNDVIKAYKSFGEGIELSNGIGKGDVVKALVASPIEHKQQPLVRGYDTGVEDNSRILLISDMHIPYHHPDLLEFLSHLKDKYKPTRVICLGDEMDKAALSYHESDPDLPSAGDELKRSLPVIAELFRMFPKMDIVESNHGSLVWRKAKTHGIPRHYIKSYNDVLGVDNGWKWSFDLTIELPNGQKCYIHHGKTSDVMQLSQQMGMCAVQGHYHETFKVNYWGNPTGLYWGLQAGCLIDDSSYAFSYNNVNIKRPVIGTAVIVDGQPILEPMLLSKGGRWINRKLD